MITRFTKRVKGNKVNSSGVEHPALFSYHSLYEVSFPNCQTEYLTSNVISQNMLSQLDPQGNHYQLLKDISDNYVDRISSKRSNGFIRSCIGNVHAKQTTRCWKLEVEWKDVTLRWITSKGLKYSNPVELAEYSLKTHRV